MAEGNSNGSSSKPPSPSSSSAAGNNPPSSSTDNGKSTVSASNGGKRVRGRRRVKKKTLVSSLPVTVIAGGIPKGSSSKPPPPPPRSTPSSSHRKSLWEPAPASAGNSLPSSSTANAESTVSPSNNSESSSCNPNPNPSSSNNLTPNHDGSGGDDLANTNPSPSTTQCTNTLPDSSPLASPPQSSYGFHMLERRTISLLVDRSTRTYFALPSDYQDFVLPPRPLHLLDQFPPLGIDGPPEVSMKRKRGEQEKDGNHDLPLKWQNGLQYGRAAGANNSGETSSSSSFLPGISIKPSKFMRVGDGFDTMGASHHYQSVDPDALKKAFIKFVKLLNESANLKKNYLQNGKLGHLPCIACERSFKDFPDVHGLVVHAYNSDNADLRVDHLGLHKALCVLMGWNFVRPPDNSMAYQFLPSEQAAANQDDLIFWPPTVMIQNTRTGKLKSGYMGGYGKREMNRRLRGLGFPNGKCRSLVNEEGHLGITLVTFAYDESGLREAIRLADYFEEENHGRKAWAEVQSSLSVTDKENSPKLFKVDEVTGEKKNILYGHLLTAFDLDKVDNKTRENAVLESKQEQFVKAITRPCKVKVLH